MNIKHSRRGLEAVIKLSFLFFLLLLTVSTQTAIENNKVTTEIDQAQRSTLIQENEAENTKSKTLPIINKEKTAVAEDEKSDNKATNEQFIPTEAISEDLSVLFPVDI